MQNYSLNRKIFRIQKNEMKKTLQNRIHTLERMGLLYAGFGEPVDEMPGVQSYFEGTTFMKKALVF